MVQRFYVKVRKRCAKEPSGVLCLPLLSLSPINRSVESRHDDLEALILLRVLVEALRGAEVERLVASVYSHTSRFIRLEELIAE